MSFGWHRAEVVGALVSVLLIWVVTGVLVSVAALRLASGDTEVEPGVMLITSGVNALTAVLSTNKVSQCQAKNLVNRFFLQCEREALGASPGRHCETLSSSGLCCAGCIIPRHYRWGSW